MAIRAGRQGGTDRRAAPQRSSRQRGAGGAARPQSTRQRAPWGSISRAQVVDAATRALQDGGYEAMTIRSLAADLGVAPMSLYRHVRDKDDLLDEVVDRLLADAWRPRRRPGRWQDYLAEAAERLRSFLVGQPAALNVYLRHPVVSPTSIERMETILHVLRESGFDDREAERAYAAVQTYTLGFAALEASRESRSDAPQDSAIARQLASFATPRQFNEGLGYLIEAIERRAGQGSRTRRSHAAASPERSAPRRAAPTKRPAAKATATATKSTRATTATRATKSTATATKATRAATATRATKSTKASKAGTTGSRRRA